MQNLNELCALPSLLTSAKAGFTDKHCNARQYDLLQLPMAYPDLVANSQSFHAVLAMVSEIPTLNSRLRDTFIGLGCLEMLFTAYCCRFQQYYAFRWQ